MRLVVAVDQVVGDHVCDGVVFLLFEVGHDVVCCGLVVFCDRLDPCGGLDGLLVSQWCGAAVSCLVLWNVIG